MLKMRQRIIERLEETDTRFRLATQECPGSPYTETYFISQGEECAFTTRAVASDRAEFADWMIRRMAMKRMQEGQQMDSIIAASYKAFLPNLMAQAIRTIK